LPQLSEKMADALNSQINLELSSAYEYLAMSTYCSETNLPGATRWLRMQWEEELSHATKLIDYMAERGSHVALRAISQPSEQFSSLLDVFERVLEHEQEVTQSIHRTYDLALQEKDYATQTLLQWYVTEQIEEENQPAEIISWLRVAGDTGAGLLMVDRRLAERQPSS
jgi:ferritin